MKWTEPGRRRRQKDEVLPMEAHRTKISYPIHEGPPNDLFLCESLAQKFEKLCHFGLYSYLQAYVVTISHLDTWFTLVLLTINILTLFQ